MVGCDSSPWRVSDRRINVLPSSSKTWYWLPGAASMMRWLYSLALGWSVVTVQ